MGLGSYEQKMLELGQSTSDISSIDATLWDRVNSIASSPEGKLGMFLAIEFAGIMAALAFLPTETIVQILGKIVQIQIDYPEAIQLIQNLTGEI